MILAIVPARRRSKSIKNKNIKLLAGKPLISYSIKTALACKKIDKTIVSTDSQKYADIAKKYGAEVPFLRPKKLAKDDTPMIPVLQHAVTFFENKGEKIETIILLQPTSPLRRVSDIKFCLQSLRKPETDSVVTVCEVEHNPYSDMVSVNSAGYLKYPLFTTDKPLHRRQDAPLVYRINGAIFAIKRNVLMKGKIFTNKTRMIKIPVERSSDIDSKNDFEYAEFLIKKR